MLLLPFHDLPAGEGGGGWLMLGRLQEYEGRSSHDCCFPFLCWQLVEHCCPLYASLTITLGSASLSTSHPGPLLPLSLHYIHERCHPDPFRGCPVHCAAVSSRLHLPLLFLSFTPLPSLPTHSAMPTFRCLSACIPGSCLCVEQGILF